VRLSRPRIQRHRPRVGVSRSWIEPQLCVREHWMFPVTRTVRRISLRWEFIRLQLSMRVTRISWAAIPQRSSSIGLLSHDSSTNCRSSSFWLEQREPNSCEFGERGFEPPTLWYAKTFYVYEINELQLMHSTPQSLRAISEGFLQSEWLGLFPQLASSARVYSLATGR